MSPHRALAAVCACVIACGSHRSDAHRVTPRGPVVARVAGEAITADEVELIARTARIDARAALERAIRDRLLIAEGTRRGVLEPADADDARWHASLQLLLAREVEDQETPARVPGDFFDALFQRRRVELVHDGLVAVVHVVALADGDAGVGARGAARAMADRFYARLTETAGPRPTREQFEAAARGVQGLRFEALPAFDRTGQDATGTHFAEPFARAAWTLTDEAPLSRPFESPFGAHVALRVGAVPPLRRSPEEVRQVIVRDGVTMRRAQRLSALLERLRAQTSIRVSESALGAPARTEPLELSPPPR